MPNNATINETNTGILPLSRSLSTHAKKAHLFNGLHSALIISLEQLCDNDCIAILDNNEINILKDKKLILKGHRNKTDRLWDIPISRPLRYCVHVIITRYKTKTELIQYLNGCCFSPILRTFLKAIKNGNFLTWPGLNNQQLLKHIFPSIASALGHLDQKRKNLQSTKQVKSELEVEEDKNFYPYIEAVKTHELCAKHFPLNIKRKGFSDPTGTFPQNSSRGNLYVMVLYDYNSNAILSEPIKNKQAATIRDYFIDIHNILKSRGGEPKVYIMKN